MTSISLVECRSLINQHLDAGIYKDLALGRLAQVERMYGTTANLSPDVIANSKSCAKLVASITPFISKFVQKRASVQPKPTATAKMTNKLQKPETAMSQWQATCTDAVSNMAKKMEALITKTDKTSSSCANIIEQLANKVSETEGKCIAVAEKVGKTCASASAKPDTKERTPSNSAANKVRSVIDASKVEIEEAIKDVTDAQTEIRVLPQRQQFDQVASQLERKIQEFDDKWKAANNDKKARLRLKKYNKLLQPHRTFLDLIPQNVQATNLTNNIEIGKEMIVLVDKVLEDIASPEAASSATKNVFSKSLACVALNDAGTGANCGYPAF